MNAVILSAVVGAALATSTAASAETQFAAPAATHSFAIVDRETGRTIGTLVAVDDGAHVFRLIGAGPRVQRPDAARSAPAPAWLTPQQFEASQRTSDSTRFYTPPDAG